jgi:hemolysin activation/secretion protein
MPFTLLSVLLAAAVPVTAPPPAPPLIIDSRRADRAPVLPAPENETKPPAGASVTVEAGAAHVMIRSIAFDRGAVPAVVARAAQTFVGKQASEANLKALAAAMSAAYANADIALYTVIMPRQDFAGGTVHVIAIEGFVEQVRIRGSDSRLLHAYAGALAARRPLTRRVMERYLSLMRDLPGASVDVQLLRGTQPGGVILQVTPKRKHRDVSFGFDNQGPSLLGDPEMRGEIHTYSMLRDGDRTDLMGLASPDFRRLLYVAGSHSTPIGDDGATLTASAGLIETRPKHIDQQGHAVSFGLTAAMPLIRGYKKNLTITLGLDGVNSDAAAFGSILSSDHTRALRIAAGYSSVSARSALSLGLTGSRGLDFLGAKGTAGFTDLTFTKVNGRVTYDRQIAKRLFVHLRAAGQWSDDKLAGAERFAVGGADFGRAFDSAFLTGDRGFAGSGELAWRPKLKGKLGGSEVYGFADAARLTIVARGLYAKGTYDLASAGGGVRLAYGSRGSLQLEGARVVETPYPGGPQGWRVNIGWRISLKH